MIQVSRLSVTPVKGFAVWHPDEVTLGETGVAEDRRFYSWTTKGCGSGP